MSLAMGGDTLHRVNTSKMCCTHTHTQTRTRTQTHTPKRTKTQASHVRKPYSVPHTQQVRRKAPGRTVRVMHLHVRASCVCVGRRYGVRARKGGTDMSVCVSVCVCVCVVLSYHPVCVTLVCLYARMYEALCVCVCVCVCVCMCVSVCVCVCVSPHLFSDLDYCNRAIPRRDKQGRRGRSLTESQVATAYEWRPAL